MSDNLNESIHSKFQRYMLDKFKQTGHTSSFKEFEAEWDAWIERYYEDEE